MNIFEQRRPIRGYRLTLAAVQNMFRELNDLTSKEKDRYFASISKPEAMGEDEYQKKLDVIRDSSFRVTVNLNGSEGEVSYGDGEDVFKGETPKNITSIYMTNSVSYQNIFGYEPKRRFEIMISFEKPPALDWNPIMSAPTENISSFSIRSDESSYARAVEGIINRALSGGRVWYSFIHAPLVYDVSLWIFAFPYSVLQISRAVSMFKFREDIQDIRFLIIIYMLMLALLAWRFVFSYVKWVFPVNVLAENKDRATLHRWLVGGIFLSVAGNFVYDLTKVFLRSS